MFYHPKNRDKYFFCVLQFDPLQFKFSRNFYRKPWFQIIKFQDAFNCHKWFAKWVLNLISFVPKSSD
ncbi:MAG: hypothetical protein D6748_11540 [Calditrichaeota bacterium]|nr:MAG: hypothetical protein D6748_11540 [Calditrichota bacterium]